MTRLRWAGVLVTVIVVAVALFELGRERLQNLDDDQAARSGAANNEAGGGGVSRPGSDLSAAATVRGQVVDEDGQPVSEGALALRCLDADDTVRRIEGGMVKLGEDGVFEGPGCRARVCAEFFHPSLVASEPWMPTVGTATTLVARPLPRLYGRVQTAGGKPIEAASVAFISGEEERDPTAVMPLMTRATTTDANGEFSVAWIERPPCGPCEEARGTCRDEPLPTTERIVATVRARGFGPGEASIQTDARPSDPDAPILITLSEGAEVLSGRLTDAHGKGYARAYVLARSIERPHEQHRADVGDAGDFELPDLGAGAYNVRAIQDGVELASQDAVTPGMDLEFVGDRSANGPTLIVAVVDDTGAPVAEARVDGGPFRGQKCDNGGEVRAARALPGPLQLRIARPGHKAVVRNVDVPAASRDAAEARVQVAVPGSARN